MDKGDAEIVESLEVVRDELKGPPEVYLGLDEIALRLRGKAKVECGGGLLVAVHESFHPPPLPISFAAKSMGNCEYPNILIVFAIINDVRKPIKN